MSGVPVSLLIRMSGGGPAVPAISPQAWRLALTLGRPIAQGLLDDAGALAAVALDAAGRPFNCAPEHVALYCRWALTEAASAWEAKRRDAEAAIGRVVWPLCDRRADGHAILAAARRVNADMGRPLTGTEVLAVCRSIAAASVGRSKNGRGR
jgi:hypothetical protein